MSPELKKTLDELKNEVFADGIRKCHFKFKGYEVYAATFNKPVCIGFPFYILADGDSAHFADDGDLEAIFEKDK